MKDWKFQYWGAPGNVQKLFAKWSPAKGDDEKHYKKELYKFLRARFKKANIQKEPDLGKIYADIVIDDYLMIKVIHNLQKSSEYRKLLGKVLECRNWMGKVLILMIGKTDPKLFERIEEDIDSLDTRLFKGKVDSQFIVINKPL